MITVFIVAIVLIAGVVVVACFAVAKAASLLSLAISSAAMTERLIRILRWRR